MRWYEYLSEAVVAFALVWGGAYLIGIASLFG